MRHLRRHRSRRPTRPGRLKRWRRCWRRLRSIRIPSVAGLLASTNPQEVLDAGNWLVGNPDIKDKALDQAAEKAGFTPPMRAIMQFRQIVDQLCLEMGWTTELGQAFTNDEAGVFAAVQRLRRRRRTSATCRAPSR